MPQHGRFDSGQADARCQALFQVFQVALKGLLGFGFPVFHALFWHTDFWRCTPRRLTCLQRQGLELLLAEIGLHSPGNIHGAILVLVVFQQHH